MHNGVADKVESFPGIRLTVVGDLMLDRYLEGSMTDVCREAPVPVVAGCRQFHAPGGAGNVAANAAKLGAQVRIIGCIGEDDDGVRLRDLLESSRIDVEDLLLSGERTTLSKSRLLGRGQILARFDQGEMRRLTTAEEKRLLESLVKAHADSDAIILSDYHYGTLSLALLARLRALQRLDARLLVADSKRRLREFNGLSLTAVKPNFSEAAALLGLDLSQSGMDRIERMAVLGEKILDLCGTRIAAVTMDRDGALVFERGAPCQRTYSRPVEDSAAVGAGDTFVAGLTLALAAGASASEAAEIASGAASVILGKQGTAVCSPDELRAALYRVPKLVIDLQRFRDRLENYRQQGKRIVFANGCFDILHSGHISFLGRARQLGDVLIVAVNDDESIARIKGHGRPINSLEDRLKVLNELSCVDHLIPFYEDTASNLVRALAPDLFVKGQEINPRDLPETTIVEELGGKVEIVRTAQPTSTSNIIQKIRRSVLFPVPFELEGEERRPPVTWQRAQKLLCIRLDTLGDVLMTGPAVRALRHGLSVTQVAYLTSSRGADAALLLPGVDDVLVWDVAWMKATGLRDSSAEEHRLIRELRERRFDAAVIFTTYSQSPLPAALVCYLADIPLRLAHCRENPYQLLTDWVREVEPDKFVRHEVERQLELVASVGARTTDLAMRVLVPEHTLTQVRERLVQMGISGEESWVVIHPGASAPSRRYPAEQFTEAARLLQETRGLPIIFTGSHAERDLIEEIRRNLPGRSFSLAGDLSLVELCGLLQLSPILLSNNTGPVHIAAAVGTPVVDLYALTNPQHTPWSVPHRVLFHDVPCKYCYKSLCPEGHHDCLRLVEPEQVVRAVEELLHEAPAFGNGRRVNE